MKHPRLFRTAYSGRYGDRTSASATMEGAVRAAMMRILAGDYDSARIYDNRFGEHDASHAVTLYFRGTSVIARWRNVELFPRTGLALVAAPEPHARLASSQH